MVRVSSCPNASDTQSRNRNKLEMTDLLFTIPPPLLEKVIGSRNLSACLKWAHTIPAPIPAASLFWRELEGVLRTIFSVPCSGRWWHGRAASHSCTAALGCSWRRECSQRAAQPQRNSEPRTARNAGYSPRLRTRVDVSAHS